MSNQEIVLVTGSYDNLIRFWKAAEQKCIQTIDFEVVLVSLSISPNKQYIAAGGFNSLKIFQLSNNQQIFMTKPDQEAVISQVLFSPSGSFLSYTSEDYYFKAISTKDMRVVFKYKNDALLGCCANFSESLVIAGDQMGKILLFEIASPQITKPIAKFQCFDLYVGVKSIHTYKQFICCADNRGLLQILTLQQQEKNQQTFQLLTTIQAHADQITCCRFSPTGQHIATVSSDKYCKIWSFDQKNIKLKKISQIQIEDVAFDLCFNSSGQFLLLGCDKTPKLIQITNGFMEVIKQYSGHSRFVTSVGLSD